MMFLLILESRTRVKLTRTLMCYVISCFAVAENNVLVVVHRHYHFISSHKDHTLLQRTL